MAIPRIFAFFDRVLDSSPDSSPGSSPYSSPGSSPGSNPDSSNSISPLACTIDILYTLDSASNYSAIQKLKP